MTTWRVWPFILVVLACVTLWHCGCTATLVNDGEVGFRQCTSWGFYSTAKDTKTESSARVEVPALEELIFEGNESIGDCRLEIGGSLPKSSISNLQSPISNLQSPIGDR